MSSFKNILVPTDFSLNSERAYEFCISLSRHSNAKIHVIHVVEPQFYKEELSSYADKISFDRDRVFDAEEDLERFINKYSISNIEIERVLKTGKPHEEIINYTKNNNIDLIIISSHGKRNLNLITGSVTKKVMKFSDVPVMCIKTNQFEQKEINETNYAENWVG